MVLQERPGGTDDQSAAVARIENVALGHVPPVEHVGDAGVAHGMRK